MAVRGCLSLMALPANFHSSLLVIFTSPFCTNTGPPPIAVFIFHFSNPECCGTEVFCFKYCTAGCCIESLTRGIGYWLAKGIFELESVSSQAISAFLFL